jgi:phenylpropionate dioxygenase-like ring-hydroxylating dioxygenase large terminal subunit
MNMDEAVAADEETLTQRRGSISPDAYYRQDVLEQEIDAIFRPSWLCVGFKQDLVQPQDFITTRIGPHSIVVQNFEGELRAFRNVCAHRFARIQCAAKGNRPLTCPYHGWTYDARGRPAGIPMNRQSFGLDDADKDALALEAYALEVVGHFVFVRMQAEGCDLKTFLGGFYDDLLHLSQMCPDRIEAESFEWEANWKLGMDNAAEAYHVPMVHPDSFGAILSMDLDLTTEGDHSRYTGGLRDRSLKWWGAVAKAVELQRSDIYPQYGNFLIFPNIIATFSYGAFLTFQTIEPVGPQTLRLNNSSWLAHNNGRAARDMVAETLRGFTRQVREEDQAICKVAQAGTRAADLSQRPVLGDMEARIKHFQQAYVRHMPPRRAT